jgi:antirestriction protein ArdC
MSGSFGSKTYAQEELVAEICGAYVCAALGIVPTVRHADYVGSWLEVLREDSRAIVRAASAASKAADYLLAFLSATDVRSVPEQVRQSAAGTMVPAPSGAQPPAPGGTRGRGRRARS